MVSSGGCRVVPTTVRKKPVVGGKKEEGIKKSSKGKISCDCHEDFDKCSKGWRTGFGLVSYLLVVTLKGGEMELS